MYILRIEVWGYENWELEVRLVLRFGVLGFGGWGLVRNVDILVRNVHFKIWGLGGFGLRVLILCFRVQGLGFKIMGFGFRVQYHMFKTS